MHNFWIILHLILGCFYVLTITFIMTRFKCSRKRAGFTLGTFSLFSFLFDFILFTLAGYDTMLQYFTLSFYIFILMAFFLLSKDRLPLLLFNLFTAINLLYFLNVLSGFFTGISSNNPWTDLGVRIIIFFITIYFFQFYLKDSYHFLAKNMQKSWWIISAIPFLYYIRTLILTIYADVKNEMLLVLIISYILLCLVYYIIYQVFKNTYDLIKKQQTEKILSTHLIILEDQLKRQKQYVDQVRILRHDMRHYAQTINILLQEGNINTAVLFIGKFDELYNQTSLPKYCANSLINSILSFYIEKAKEETIKVKTQLEIPESLPVDSIELSILFANVIENACNACRNLPANSHKCIEILCISQPQFALEISNSCALDLEFSPTKIGSDSDNLHGIGTQSIASFAKKYHMLLSCKIENGMFRLRMAMPPN